MIRWQYFKALLCWWHWSHAKLNRNWENEAISNNPNEQGIVTFIFFFFFFSFVKLNHEILLCVQNACWLLDCWCWHVLNLIHTSAILNSFHTVQHNYFNYEQTATRSVFSAAVKKKTDRTFLLWWQYANGCICTFFVSKFCATIH